MFLVKNNEDEQWRKGLVLAYLQAATYEAWTRCPIDTVIALTVPYQGHQWRAVLHADNNTFPRLELQSTTTTTVVSVPVEQFINLLSSLHQVIRDRLWEVESALICLANNSEKGLV